MMRRGGFSLASGPVHTPGVRLAVRPSAPRAACLEADLDQDGELFVDPARVVSLSGQLAITPVSMNLVLARGAGSLIMGPAGDGEIALIMLPPDATILLAPNAFLAATIPVRTARQTLGDADEWILLQSGADRAALVALASLGTYARHMLGAGEALDVAADALLIVDGAVDLAVGIHLDVPGNLGFVQCLGAGGIVVQAG